MSDTREAPMSTGTLAWHEYVRAYEGAMVRVGRLYAHPAGDVCEVSPGIGCYIRPRTVKYSDAEPENNPYRVR